jgi:ribosome biogenesis GTPase
MLSEISGKLRHEAINGDEFPSVGDFVVASLRTSEMRATIHKVLPRKSKFSRKVAGVNTVEQIVASNIDTIFLVNSLNKDFKLWLGKVELIQLFCLARLIYVRI